MNQNNIYSSPEDDRKNVALLGHLKEPDNQTFKSIFKTEIFSPNELDLSSEQEMVEEMIKTLVEEHDIMSEWRSRSAFTVEFNGSFEVDLQTRQIQGNTAQRLSLKNLKTTAGKDLAQQLRSQISPVLAGMAEQELQQWLLDRLQTHLPLESLVLESSRIETPIALDITDLHIVQPCHLTVPMMANPDNPLFPDSILGDRPFDLAVTIALPESAIADLQDQVIVLVAICEARHLTTGTVTQWGETRMTVKAETRSRFTLVLRDLLVSELGAYRVRVLANLQNLPAIESVFKVPVLEVETPDPARCAI